MNSINQNVPKQDKLLHFASYFQNYVSNFNDKSLVGCHVGDSERKACNKTGNFVVKRFSTSNDFGFFS